MKALVIFTLLVSCVGLAQALPTPTASVVISPTPTAVPTATANSAPFTYATPAPALIETPAISCGAFTHGIATTCTILGLAQGHQFAINGFVQLNVVNGTYQVTIPNAGTYKFDLEGTSIQTITVN